MAEEKVVVLTIRGRTEGIDQAKAQLSSLGVKYDEVNRRLTEQVPQLDRLAQNYNDVYRVQQQYQKQVEQLARANQTYIDKTGDVAKAQQLYQTALTGLNTKHQETLRRANEAATGLSAVGGMSR